MIWFLVDLLTRWAPKGPWARLVHRTVLDSKMGYAAAYSHHELDFQRGVTISPLHPCGRARFGETLVDVTTQGEFIGENEIVKVKEVHGAQVIVQRIEEIST